MARSSRRTVITFLASVAVVAAAVGILISRNEDHQSGSVVQPSDLTALAVDWHHTAAAADCAVVGCLDSGLVIGPRALLLDEVDLSFAPTVFRGSFGRAYRSDLASSPGGAGLGGMFGTGWVSVLDSRLSVESTRAVLVTPPTSDRVVGLGRLDGTPTALWGSGELWQFDTGARIVRIESPTGRTMEVGWDGDSLSTISFEGGQEFQVTTDADSRITEVAGSDGRTVAYRYVDGRLAGVTTPSGESTYSYDGDGLLESASTPSGVTEVAYDDVGHVSELSTGATRSLEVSGTVPTVTVHESQRDSTSVYEFDPDGRLVRAVADGAQVLARSFDDSDRLVQSDAPGEHVEISYDGGGRVSRVVENGAATGYVYDSLSRTVQVTAADGGVTAYGYEGSSALPSSVTDPVGAVTELSYDDGRLAKVVDPDGVAQRYRYDDTGDLVAVTDGGGAETTFEYDEAGRVVGSATPEGARSQASFDDAGRVEVAGAPDGTRTAFSYNTAGQPTAVISPEGVSSFAYDEDGQLAAQTDPTGARVDYGYTDGDVTAVGVTPSGSSGSLAVALTGDDYGGFSARGPGGETRVVAYSDGRPSEIDLPGGRRESLSYDAGGRMTEVRIDGVLAASYAYDPIGRLVRSEDGDGLVEERSYDPAGRLIEIRYPDGTAWSATWSLGGRIESVTDPEGRQTTWSYDDAGRVDAMTSPMGSTVQVQHDDDGRVTGLTEQRGVSWAFRYDAGGRLATADTPAGPVDYEWDRAGRLVSRVDSGGEQSRWLYDDHGRLYNVKLPGEHNDLDWRYDSFGNVSGWEQGDQRWEVERDDAGRPVSVDPPDEGDDYTIGWDDAGNPVELRYGDTIEQRSFDALGRVVEASYGDDDTFEYRSEGRTTDIVDQGDDGSDPIVRYERDDRGRVVHVQWGSDDDEQVRAQWDYAGRPVTISNGDHETTVIRDDDGRPTQVQLDGDTTLTARYEDGQIASIATPDEDLLDLDYDDGRVSQAQSEDLAVTFDAQGRPDTFRTSGDDGQFRYADDGTVTGLQYGEDLTTATPGPDGLDTAGDAGNILQDVFEPDGTFRGLPAADSVPQFTYLDGLPDEFTPAGLTPTSPEEQVAQTVAAIDVTVPEPLKLDGSPEEIARAAADEILTTPLALPVHPASTALVALFNDEGDPTEAFSPLDGPVWDGLLGGIVDRQDTTGAFDWVTAQITNLADWTTAALSTVARSVINSFTDPVTLITGVSVIALSAACVFGPFTCPLLALKAIDAGAFLVPALVTAFTSEQSLADIAVETVIAVAVATAITLSFELLLPTLASVPVEAEVELEEAAWGASRSVQNNRANAALEAALADDPALAVRLEELSPGAAEAVSRNGGRATPDGFTWHHAHSSTVDGRIGVMQLVPTEVHAPGSAFQELLHPGGIGGYTEWAIPRGAPTN